MILKTRSDHVSIMLAFLALQLLTSSHSRAQIEGTAFTYAGQLQNNGSPATTGLYDFQFVLSNAPSGGRQVGNLLTATVGVTNGLFTTTLDFGAVFADNATWLGISVRPTGVGNYISLTPLQQLTPTPYAIYAESVNAAGLSGTIPAADFGGAYGNAVTFNNPANSFSGNGGGLSNLNVNAQQLTSIGNNNGGFFNFFIGQSGNSTMSGSGNTAMGNVALNHNTTGSDNSANGFGALFFNANGSDNTANGYEALINNKAGSNNIALGYQAGFNILGSSNIDIGNPGLATDTDIIRIGNGQSQTFIAGVITNTSTLAINGGADMNLAANNNLNVMADLAMELESATSMKIQSGASMAIKSGSGLTLSGTELIIEGPATINSSLTVQGISTLAGGLVVDGNIGIGTTGPQQALSLVGGMNIDQGGQNVGNVYSNALTFGSGSGEGLVSKRTSGGAQYDLEFYTDFYNRMTIFNGGGVAINTNSAAGASLNVSGTFLVSNPGGPALTIGAGAIHVSGAGQDTSTAAFSHMTTAGNISGNLTVISNPQCNGDPNAILMITRRLGSSGFWNHPVCVYYDGAYWDIENEDQTAMPAGLIFNVLILKN
jgi:hypothetical protein